MRFLNHVSFLAIVFTVSGVFAQDAGTSTFPTPERVASREEMKPHVALTAGSVDPEGAMKTTVGYGLDVGWQPYIPFGVGFELATSSTDNGSGESLSRTHLLGRGTYNFGGTVPVIKDSFVGLGVGPVFESDGTKLASSPILGFDIPLSSAPKNYLSLGMNAAYLITEGSSPDAGIVNGVLKYWF